MSSGEVSHLFVVFLTGGAVVTALHLRLFGQNCIGTALGRTVRNADELSFKQIAFFFFNTIFLKVFKASENFFY